VSKESPAEPIEEAMNRLWAKYLPQLGDRIATLEKAAKDLADGNLAIDQREEASSDAHKLAGVLGTFGLQEGTLLAREAEAAYQGELAGNGTSAARMAEIAAKLRAILASRA
jgi:HPt (histidine-containing phosphotransfer) domain-containing protein